MHTYALTYVCLPVCTHDCKWRPHKLPAMASFSCFCQLSTIVNSFRRAKQQQRQCRGRGRACGSSSGSARQVHKKAAARPKINCQIF